jgi:hypothetical protein
MQRLAAGLDWSLRDPGQDKPDLGVRLGRGAARRGPEPALDVGDAAAWRLAPRRVAESRDSHLARLAPRPSLDLLGPKRDPPGARKVAQSRGQCGMERIEVGCCSESSRDGTDRDLALWESRFIHVHAP